MSKTSRRLFDPITTPAELKAEIDRAGAWFIREYIDELADNFDQFRTKELKINIWTIFTTAASQTMVQRKNCVRNLTSPSASSNPA